MLFITQMMTNRNIYTKINMKNKAKNGIAPNYFILPLKHVDVVQVE